MTDQRRDGQERVWAVRIRPLATTLAARATGILAAPLPALPARAGTATSPPRRACGHVTDHPQAHCPTSAVPGAVAFTRAWADAVSGTSFLPMSRAELEAFLLERVLRLGRGLQEEPFRP